MRTKSRLLIQKLPAEPAGDLHRRKDETFYLQISPVQLAYRHVFGFMHNDIRIIAQEFLQSFTPQRKPTVAHIKVPGNSFN